MTKLIVYTDGASRGNPGRASIGAAIYAEEGGDIWEEEVCECLAETGAELLIVPNGSPYWTGKMDLRMNKVAARIAETAEITEDAAQATGTTDAGDEELPFTFE